MAPSRRSARTPTNPRVASSSASIARPVNGKTSLRLTVKAPPSKLRQATSGSAIPPNPYANDQSESDATPAPPRRAARATRNPRKIVDADSDDMDEDPEDEPEEDMDQELLAHEDSEEDAEGEEDEDVEMEDHPPAPVITQRHVPGKAKPQVSVTAPPEGTLKSVEAKEMEDDNDEELSELDSQEEEELEGNGEDEDEDDEDDDSEEDDEDGSRSATPDLSKLTKRQRGAFNEFEGAETNEFLALSNEALKKKHLTAEEHVQRRAEMARRRKNLSEKRNEEEKMETINKLLHKQAPKRRTRAEMEAARAAEAGETPAAERDANALDPTYVRWVSRKEGSLVCVPQSWQDSPVGEQFRPSSSGGRMMVEEVQ